MTSIEGIIVNSSGQARKRVEINDAGIIAKVSEPTGVADIVLGEELIFPGFIDLHVHAREDASVTQTYKEDFATASNAAINGGIVAFAEMPNNPTPPIDNASYATKKELTKKSSVEVVLYAGIGPTTNPLCTKVPYKVFMGHSVGNTFFTNFEDLEKAIARYEGQYVSFHCEDPKMLDEHKDDATHESRRPPEAEISAIDFALILIRKYNLVGKICHCSTVSGIEKIIKAKKDGVNVTVEVTPTHLFFDSTTKLGVESGFMQMNPPVRSSHDDRLKLIEYLKNGSIDYLATDHAPHTIEEKQKGTSGIPHLDTYAPVATWLAKEHGFTAQDIARACAENPSVFFNQFSVNKYGKVEEGFVGSLTVVDMNKPITISKEFLKTKCGWSPFEGFTFPGSVKMTIVNGKVYEN